MRAILPTRIATATRPKWAVSQFANITLLLASIVGFPNPAEGQSPLPYVVPESERMSFFDEDISVTLQFDQSTSPVKAAAIQQALSDSSTAPPYDANNQLETTRNGTDSFDSLSLQALAELVKKGVVIESVSLSSDSAQPTAGINTSDVIERDPDGDGLTTTEERWWGTNPEVADTDGDGYSDGEEIARARAGDHSAGIPWPNWPVWGQRPNANIGWGWGDDTEAPIVDLDQDSIPDAAELFVLGFNQNYESTDNDRYDDGQEFWGITQIGRGALPRAVDSDFLLAEMPNFVDAPGRSPLATAYPTIDIDVENNTIKVLTRQTIRSENKEIREQENVYEVETTVFNEVTESSLTSLNEIHSSRNFTSETQEPPPTPETQMDVAVPVAEESSDDDSPPPITDADFDQPASGVKNRLLGATLVPTGIDLAADVLDVISIEAQRKAGDDACYEIVGGLAQSRIIRQIEGDLVTASLLADTASAAFGVIDAVAPLLAIPTHGISLVVGEVAAVGSELADLGSAGLELASNLIGRHNRSRTRRLLTEFDENNCEEQGYTFSADFVDEFLDLLQAREFLQSQGTLGSTGNLTTREENEESDLTDRLHEKRYQSRSSKRVRTRSFQRMFTREEWSKATTVDTHHAADLVFNLAIANTGTDVVRSINSVILNIFIGDDDVIDHTLNLLGTTSPINQIENLFPGDTFRINLPVEIPLTLEETKLIDSGADINIVIERIEYGDDQLFYENAYTGGTYFLIDDGIDDADPSLIPFLLPTWGDETYLDVLSRVSDVFRLNFENGGLKTVDVPIYDAQHRIAGFKNLPNGGKQRWLVFSPSLTGADFSTIPAQPESTMLFVFQKDEDEDGFTDAEEFAHDTNFRDPNSHPKPEIVGALTTAVGPNGNTFASLILENRGNYPATGIDAQMYSPDGNLIIEKNFTGGGGILNPGQRVVIGPRFLAPDLSAWTGDTLPLIGGTYEGDRDLLFVGTVIEGGNVGSENSVQVRITWANEETVLELGATGPETTYSAPHALAIGNTGLSLAFTSGFLVAGEGFSIQASAFGDAFEYRAADASEPLRPELCLLDTWQPTDEWLFDRPGLELISTGELGTTIRLSSQGAILEDGLVLDGARILTAPSSGTEARYQSYSSTWKLRLTTTGNVSATLIDQGNRELYLHAGQLKIGLGPLNGGIELATGTFLSTNEQYEITISYSESAEATLDVVGLVRSLTGDTPTQTFEIEDVPLPENTELSTILKIGGPGLRGAGNFIGRLRYLSYLDTALVNCFGNGLLDPEQGSTAVILSYNSPQGHFRQHVPIVVEDRTSPLLQTAAPRGTSLSVALYPYLDAEYANTIHAKVYSSNRIIENASLFYSLVDPSLTEANVVWSHHTTTDLQSGWNYDNQTIPLDAIDSTPGKLYHLYVTLTDETIETSGNVQANGNLIDETLRSLAINPIEPENPSADLQFSTNELTTESITAGAIAQQSITVANTGSRELRLLFPVADRRLAVGALNDSLRLAAGQSLTLQLGYDTIGLPSGSHSVAIQVEANGRPIPALEWQVNVVGDSSLPGLFPRINETTPWTINLLARGPILPFEIVTVDLGDAYDEAEFIALTLSRAGTIIGNGPYTSFAGAPNLVNRSTINPSVYYVRLPYEIPANSEEALQLKIGQIMLLDDPSQPYIIQSPPNLSHLDSLSVVVPKQSFLSSPFRLQTKSQRWQDGNTAQAISTLDNLTTRLLVRHKSSSGTTPPVEHPNLALAESILLAQPATFEAQYSTEETGDLRFLLSFGGGSNIQLPEGDHALHVDFDIGNATGSLFVDNNFHSTLQLGDGTLQMILAHGFISDGRSYTERVEIGPVHIDGEELLAFNNRIFDPNMGTEEGAAEILPPRLPGNAWRIFVSNFPKTWINLQHKFTSEQVASMNFQLLGESTLLLDGDDFRILPNDGSVGNLTFDSVTVTPHDQNIVLESNHEIFRSIPLNAENMGNTRIEAVWTDLDLATTGGLLELAPSSENLGGLFLAVSDLKLSEPSANANLQAIDFVLTEDSPSDGFLPGSTVNITGTISNEGTGPAQHFTVAFYSGDPLADGVYLGSLWIDQEIPESTNDQASTLFIEDSLTLPLTPGSHNLFAYIDPFNGISESSELDNIAPFGPSPTIQIAFPVGFAVDSGSPDNDPPYDSLGGFGYLNGVALPLSQDTAELALTTGRFAIEGFVEYRFNNLDPTAAYNLDLAFHQPDGLPVQYQVLVDNRFQPMFTTEPNTGFSSPTETISLNLNGSGPTVFASGYLADTAIADGTVTVHIRTTDGSPATISQIQLHRGARIYLDAGAEDEPAWSSQFADPETGIRYGYDDTDATALSFGNVEGSTSLESQRFAPLGLLRYRFSELSANHDYLVRPYLRGLPGTFQAIHINGIAATPPIALRDTIQQVNILISQVDIADNNGQIVVDIVRVDENGSRHPGVSTLIDLELNEFSGSTQISVDSDLDGLPDWFELNHANDSPGLDPTVNDASIDFDDDGVTTLNEFHAGTDPFDEDSRLGFTHFDLDRATETLSLRWHSKAGRSYTIEHAHNGVDNWTALASIPQQATAAPHNQVINVSDLPMGHLRLRTRNPFANDSNGRVTSPASPYYLFIRTNGRVALADDPDIPVAGTILEILTDNGPTTTTGIVSPDGTFEFDIPEDTPFVLKPRKDAFSTASHGVDILDIIRLLTLLEGIPTDTSAATVIAADVNRDGVIDQLDLAAVIDVVLHHQDAFSTDPQGNAQSTWRFVRRDHPFAEAHQAHVELFENPTIESFRLESPGADFRLQTEFLGIKLGDVNGDWHPSE